MIYNGPRSPDDPGRYIPVAIRELVTARDGGVCQYCGSDKAVDMDHVYPWAQGGTHDPTNLVLSCGVCNSIAGIRTFSEFVTKRDYIIRRRTELGRTAVSAAYTRVARGLRANVE